MRKLNNFQNIHPATYWLLGLLAVVTSCLSFDPTTLGLIVALSLGIAISTRGFGEIRIYLLLGFTIAFTRLLFAIVFNYQPSSTNLIFALPSLRINLGALGQLQLLGNVSVEAFNAAAIQALRLMAIVMSIGFSAAMANPRKLLKYTPAAFYEFAAAISVAINLVPQLTSSIKRIKQARRIKHQDRQKFLSIVIPVLEDAVDSSLALAASMDSRGFGRNENLLPRQRRSLRGLLLIALLALFAAVFSLLGDTSLNLVALPCTILGLLALSMNLLLASKYSVRTSARKQRFTILDYCLLSSALLACAAVIVVW